MPMFDDPKKELNRLQRELLEEEETFEEEYRSEEDWLDDQIAEAKAMLGMDEEEEEEPEIYRNYANGYGRQQPRPVPRQEYVDVEDEEEEELPPLDDTRGQRILTFLLMAGILAVAGYWAVVLL